MVPDTRRRLEDQPANRRTMSRRGTRRSSRGLDPSYSNVCLREDLDQRSASDRQGGGDEETRTPDPLLAKEMLFQLSYVPVLTGGAEWWAFLDSNQRPLPYQGSALTN